jgi:hypothetical protein
MKTQAERVYAKFGGVRNLYKALQAAGRARHITSIYRWNHPREAGGTGGLVPSSAVPDLLVAARLEGVVLTHEDLYPGKVAS